MDISQLNWLAIVAKAWMSASGVTEERVKGGTDAH